MLRNSANPDSVEDSHYAEETEFFLENSVSLRVLHFLFRFLVFTSSRFRFLRITFHVAKASELLHYHVTAIATPLT